MSYQPPPDPYQPGPPPSAPVGQYSPDGRWYWDGRQWNPVTIPGPPWARPYAPPEGRSAAAVALIALACAGIAFFVPGRLLEFIAVLAASPGFALAASIFFLLGDIILVAGGVGSAIAVPMWMHLAYRNLPALGEQGLRWSPAWAAGGWFIPFVNLVIPYQVVRDLWSSFGDGRSLPQLWWTAWIGAGVLNLVAALLAPFSLPVADFIGIVSALAVIAAGFLLITMIRRITRRERDRQTQRQSQGW